jgi:hypothetical protein
LITPMLVVSAGMQKSGTGWYFNLTNDLLVAAGFQDARTVRRRFGLQGVLKHYNCYLDRMEWSNVLPLMIPYACGNTFVIKTHDKPTPVLRRLISLKIAKATYLYRDPRDVVVSALEHGQRLRAKRKGDELTQLASIADAIRYVSNLLDIWEAWSRPHGVLFTRYEDLLADPVREANRLAGFLHLKVSSERIGQVVATYRWIE